MRWTFLALLSPTLALAAAASALVPARREPLPVPAARPLQDDGLSSERDFFERGGFESEVRPLLAAHCAECHGGMLPEADLDLGSSAGLAAARSIAGLLDGARGSLARAVAYTDPYLRMPPDGRLDDAAIAMLVRWAEAGAPLPQSAAASAPVEAFDLEARRDAHWAWRPVTDPAAPQVDAALADRARDPLDAFLFAKMREEGLDPNGPAADTIWLRRATFAVTGLPPTVPELVTFEEDVATSGATQARERAVDRLLDSPRYGERWARHWLDLMRYAETKAHEFDFPIPNAHVYRDYVIRAFDADVPYDRFVTEHIAGDLLGASDEGPRFDPSGTFDESPLATGWWFLYEDVHSPVDSRADECDRIANQVDTLAKSMLGMTVACARCHDHKFDAISAEDYHALAGFALSTGYRQVRYETDAIEREVAARVAAHEAEFDRGARAAWGIDLEESDGRIERFWADVQAVAEIVHKGVPAPAGMTGSTFDVDPALDVVLEDFEGVRWGDGQGPLRPWVAEGEAFLDRSMTKDDCQNWHDVRSYRGEGFVNAYAGHGDGGDTHTGRLTSAPFEVTRRYLHFLVSGGDHDSTQVRLERGIGDAWEVVRTASGRRSNVYEPRRFDVGDLVGATVRLVLVDEATGGWGHIGCDHVVASDYERPVALERAHSAAEWEAISRRVLETCATASEVELDALLVGGAALASQPFDGLAQFVGGPAPGWSFDEHFTFHELVVNFARFAGQVGALPLIQNGHAFKARPRGIYVDSDGALEVQPVSAVVFDPGFGKLRGVGQRHGGSMTYEQAGRTFVTPTFRYWMTSLWYLVRGSGRVFATIDSHRMVSGPLYADTLRSFDTAGEWQWVEHPLTSDGYPQVRLEFTAESSTSSLQVAAVIQSFGIEGFDSAKLTSPGPFLRATPYMMMAHAHAAGLTPNLAAFIGRHLAERERILADLPTTSKLAPAALELEGRDEYVLRRGDHRSPAAPAPRRDLAAVRTSDEPLAPNGAGSGRLELARAWTDPAHPLVARVWVNRVWKHAFGRGIVATPDDFGVMGAAPTHPELLDALARDFVADGWSTKRLLRRLLLSDAFARSSEATDEQRALDPDNRLLARASVRRLEAEAVRDALLFVAGSLDETPFGPSVPVYLTPFMNGRGRPGESGPLDGANRRSIYQAVRRNFLAPFLTVFDFPNPAGCAGRRTVSNVPAQALAFMNDPFVALCAERAGERARTEPGDDRGRIRRLWLRALGREPTADEQEGALAFVASPELADVTATWADLAHTVFGLEDFLWLR